MVAARVTVFICLAFRTVKQSFSNIDESRLRFAGLGIRYSVEETILVFPKLDNKCFSSALHIQTIAKKDGRETGSEVKDEEKFQSLTTQKTEVL